MKNITLLDEIWVVVDHNTMEIVKKGSWNDIITHPTGNKMTMRYYEQYKEERLETFKSE